MIGPEATVTCNINKRHWEESKESLNSAVFTSLKLTYDEKSDKYFFRMQIYLPYSH